MPNIRRYIQFLAILPISLIPIVAPLPREYTNPDHNIGADGNLVAQHEMLLTDRQPDKWVNQVFADNILLNLAYLRNGHVESQASNKLDNRFRVNWNQIKQPSRFEFTLNPNQTFAFHEDVLPQYQNSLAKTTSAHFNAAEGFKSDGYLFGDGVCHLASLIYWVAKEAGLAAEAPTNHNFMKIADIPKEYGVSIYSNPFQKGSNAKQNLYITNNKSKPITFKFDSNEKRVKVSITLID